MSRYVCFFTEDGLTGTCINEDQELECQSCKLNPWAGMPIPKDRVLRMTMTNDLPGNLAGNEVDKLEANYD